MATIETVRNSIELTMEARIVPWIWGERGLGKSSIVKQLCLENGWGFIDLRCSQLEASDVRGLPDRINGRTRYLPPSDLPIGDKTSKQIAEELGEAPSVSSMDNETEMEALRVYSERWSELQKHYPRGILFLDELNRAADDVTQAVFQLVLDRKVGDYTLPPGWGIVAAGNYMEGDYQTNNFTDAAFINRFSHIQLSAGTTTVNEWVNWMSQNHGHEAAEVLEYIGSNVMQLDGDLRGDLGFAIKPSRRSWDAVTRVMTVVHNNQGRFTAEAIHAVNAGLIGQEQAIGFLKYSCPVKPQRLLEEGLTPYKKAIQNLERGPLQGLTWGLISYAKDRITEDKVATVCLDFMEFVASDCKDKDLAIAFGHQLTASDFENPDDQKVAMAVIGNALLNKYVNRALEKQRGGSESTKKMFIHRLNERPYLQKLMKDTVWHSDPQQTSMMEPSTKGGKKK